MKIINNFSLDLSDLPAVSEVRNFSVTGTNGAMFSLEIKNEDSSYYNFTTQSFQATKTGLSNQLITNGAFKGFIKFPTITDDDHYDIYLYAEQDTKHIEYNEVRFGDGTIDINSSTGSSSTLLRKIIYQYTDITLTLAMYNPTAAFTISSLVNDTITLSRGKSGGKVPFSISCNSASGASFTIKKQPTSSDILTFLQPTVGSAPEKLPGENEYPAISDTDTVDGDFTAGTSTKIVMDTNVANKMVVGDKITIETTNLTDTVDGAVSSGQKIVMDNNVNTKMAVGDRVLGITGVNDTSIVSVTHLNPDSDNVKEFQIDLILGGSTRIADGDTLTFVPKCNRQLFTVAALNPDGDNAKEFSYVADDGGGGTFGMVDGATLSFSNRKNYQWPLDNINNIEEGMIVVPSTNITTGTRVGQYLDTITINENTPLEEKIVKNQAPALNTKAQKPTVVKGLVTVQAGNVVFNKQQALALAGDALKIGGYGVDKILKVHGYEVKFTNLAIALAAVTTTTTSASSSSTSVALTARDGILNGTSTVSGIGINPAVADPTVNSGANATGAGTVVLSAAQTLEDGITLTFSGAGKTATITGEIEILKAGTASATLRFDVEKLLTSG